MMATTKADDFTARMFDAANGMMLDILAAVARKIMRIVGGGRPRDRRRQRLKGAIEAEPRTWPVTTGLPQC
jgi:hypothetical protein